MAQPSIRLQETLGKVDFFSSQSFCCSLRTCCFQNPCPGPEALAHLAALIHCTGHFRHMTQEFDSSQAFPQGCCEPNPHQLGQLPRESQEQSLIQESQPNISSATFAKVSCSLMDKSLWQGDRQEAVPTVWLGSPRCGHAAPRAGVTACCCWHLLYCFQCKLVIPFSGLALPGALI